MGSYLNPGNNKFKRAVNSDIYVDKTGLMKYTNSIVDTLQSCVCVSRPRRFGKSMAADMLTAYYSKGCDSRELFSSLEIAKDENFEEHLNKYDTIFLNMQEFLSRSSNVKELLERVEGKVIRELKKQYPDVELYDENDLAETMQDIFAESECPFIVIIDEWDCLFYCFLADRTFSGLLSCFQNGGFLSYFPFFHIMCRGNLSLLTYDCSAYATLCAIRFSCFCTGCRSSFDYNFCMTGHRKFILLFQH